GQSHVSTSSLSQTLGNFRQMSVTSHAIGVQGLRGFRQQTAHSSFSASAADTGFCIGNQTGGVNQTGLQQRNKTKLHSSRITTRNSNQCGLTNFGAIDFRQTIDRQINQFGTLMLFLIPVLPLGSVFQTEVCRQVDSTHAA